MGVLLSIPHSLSKTYGSGMGVHWMWEARMGKYRKTITLDPKFWVYIRQQAEVRGISMAKFIEHLVSSEMASHQNAPTACVSERLQ